MTITPFPTLKQVGTQAGQGALHYVLRLANTVAAAVDRRTPEAAAIAAWLDQSRAVLGVPDGDDFAASGPRTQGVPATTWRRLRATLSRGLRASAPDADLSKSAADLWLDSLAAKLSLDAHDRDILALTLYYGQDARLERLVDRLSASRGGMARLTCDHALIALLLGCEQTVVEARLRPAARLRDSGLLQVDRDSEINLIRQLATLVRAAIPPDPDPFEQLLGNATLPTLDWADFAHLGAEAEVAARMLRAAVAGHETGVNILLYGPPGTGKTTFAATLAAHVGARLRAVTEEDEEGGEPHRYERLAGLQLADRLAPPGETVLLFDEAEDVFAPRDAAPRGTLTNSRVFIHRLLERTRVPVIWTANEIGGLGPAVLRRMTMCLRLDIPGAAVRARLWRSMAAAEGVALAEADVAHLARVIPAAPAIAATAMRATRLAGGDASTARLIVDGLARAVAGGRATVPGAERPERYDPALVHADRDLLALADRLARPEAPRGVSFLLSGPSGTGKSAWARHLADRMGLDVLQKRASDLLGMYVGETEANIAAAFAEARQSGAFLVFDEADSLLGERGGAVRNWEVSQVNEMLTWMEEHPLPFACTTNLPDRLDRASLRRFMVKLRFDWMTAEQARLAFARFFDLPAPAGLDDLRALTPADFALVRRRAEVTGEERDAAALLALLAAESEGRDGPRLGMGFRRDPPI